MTDHLKGRRKNPRFSMTIKGFYFYNDEWIKCKIYDLNLEGAGIKTGNRFKENNIINIKFDTDLLPEDEVEDYIIKANVVNKMGNRIGIKFPKTNKKDIKFLSDLINAYSNRYKIE